VRAKVGIRPGFRARGAERAELRGGVLGTQLAACEPLQDLATAAGGITLVGRRLCLIHRFGLFRSGGRLAQTQRPHQRVDAPANGGVGDPQLALHLLEVAARPKEALEQ
jgi:hypothetical protein